MKVLDIVCDELEADSCHEIIKETDPNVISIVHEPHNHILIFSNDYDSNGHVKKSSVTNTVNNKITSKFSEKFNRIVEKEFV